MKNIFLLIVVYNMGLNISGAQNTLQIFAPKAYVLDTTASIRWRLSVQINDLSLAKVIHFSGIAHDSSVVIGAVAFIIKKGGSYFSKYDGTIYPVLGNNAYIIVGLSKSQFNSIKFISVYAEDKSGIATEQKNITLN